MIKTLYEPFKAWSKTGSVYIISDTHFYDSDCNVMNPLWPSVDEAIKNINSVVTKNDTLVILGDVGDEKCVSRINAGRKVLVMGNHDKGASRYMRQKVKVKYDMETHSKDDVLAAVKKKYPSWNIDISVGTDVSHAPFKYYSIIADNGLFDEVYTGALMVGERLLLSHEPVYLPFVTNIHGHAHSGNMRYRNGYGCKCLNLASDVCGYMPVNLGTEIKNGILSDTPSLHRLTIDKEYFQYM